jgi:hypothetical protein
MAIFIMGSSLILNLEVHNSLDFLRSHTYFGRRGIVLGTSSVFNNLLSAPKSGPRNLQVYNATSNSLTVKWDPASGRVQKYRLTYQPSTGEGNEQTVICFVKMITWIHSTYFSSNSFYSQCVIRLIF